MSTVDTLGLISQKFCLPHNSDLPTRMSAPQHRPTLTRRQILGGAATLLTLSVNSVAFGASVVAVRLWPSPQYTRLTIESDSRLLAKHTYFEQPPRLVIDLDDLLTPGALADTGQKVLADDPNVAAVHLLPGAGKAVRLSIELKRPVSPQIFNLGPVATYAHRLVIDLYGTSVADPLGDLINKQLSQKSLLTSSRIEAAAPVSSSPQNASQATVRPSNTNINTDTKSNANANNTAKSGSKSKGLRQVMIAIDPGHGGEDPGATGPGGTREKDVVLSIARKLHERITQARLPGMVIRSYLTRDDDYFVPLNLRVEKAQGVNADLLISIHADAFSNATTQGASIFALSERGASSATAKWMADKENNADLVGGINLKAREETIQRVMLDMSTSAQIRDSLIAGTVLLKQVGKVTALHKNTVEQAGFAVLKAPDIPSVLVETAFISNPDEEAMLRSAAYQDELVDALMQGIALYFSQDTHRAKLKTS